MRYFKLPLIVTGIALLSVILLGIGGMVMIDRSGGNEKDKVARAGMLGTGLALATSIVIAPFWIFAAGKFGKERRERLEREKSKSESFRKPLKKKRRTE